MKREEARCITLEQFLYYVDDGDVIQVCFEGEEWENYIELTKSSKFLKPFLKFRVACMGPEVMDNGNQPTIRISLDDSNMDYRVHRNTGRWEDGHCSSCGEDIADRLDTWAELHSFLYCPACGARMEDE